MLTCGRVEMSRLVDLLMILIGFGIANVATVRRYVGAQMKYFNKGKLNVFCYVLRVEHYFGNRKWMINNKAKNKLFCYGEWNTTLSLPLSGA